MAPLSDLLTGAPSSLVGSSAGVLPDPLTGFLPVAKVGAAALPVSAAAVGSSPSIGAVPTPMNPLAATPAGATTTNPLASAALAAPATATAAVAAPVTAVAAAVIPPSPLAAAANYAGTSRPVTYERFAAQFRIKLEDINHLLKLVNPAKYGKFFATDIFGKQYEISGVRTSDSFGNNLSNAGVDLKYGTADDIKPTDPNYKKNSQGVGAEYWANAETPFSRLTKPNGAP